MKDLKYYSPEKQEEMKSKYFISEKKFNKLYDRQYWTEGDLYDIYYPDKDKDAKKYVSRKMYRDIISRYCSLTEEELFEKGYSKLPSSMGELRIRKYKAVKKPIDWALFRATGEYKFHENEHSNGYIFKIVWEGRPKLTNGCKFVFEATREFKSRLNQYVKSNSFSVHKYDTIRKGSKK